jgi:RecA-family ATPase
MNPNEYIENVQRVHNEMIAEADRLVKELKAEEEAKKGNYEDLKTLREKQWLTKQPPRRKFIFNYKEAFDQESGFLPAGKACMIASPGGCGKTFLLTHCALAAATGTEWLNAKAVEPIKVLFVAAEEDEDELWNRFFNMAKSLQLDRNQELLDMALDNIIAIPQRGRSQRFIDDRGKPTKSYEDLKETLNQDPTIKLVILDPASRFMGSDTEISNAAATDWVNLIDALTLAGGCPTVLVAHHTNKTALRPVANDKTPIFDQSMCRGASALVDGFRWVLGLQRSESNNDNKSIFVKLLKTNYCKIGNTLEFIQDFNAGGILKLKGIAREHHGNEEAKTTNHKTSNHLNDRDLIKSCNHSLLQNGAENDW